MTNILSKLFFRAKNYYLQKQLEKEKNLNNIEEKLQEILELLFIKEYSKEDLRKSLFIKEETFEFLSEFAKKKGYVAEVLISKPKSGLIIKIEDKGIDFLFEYRKIRAQERSNKSMKWATIVMAISAILTLYLSFISTSPQVAPTDIYTCPASFKIYEDYSQTVNVPLRNIGRLQSQTNVELMGVNVDGESIKNNYIIPSLENSDYYFKVNISNPRLDYAEYYFKISYRRPFNSMGISTTRTCVYKKDSSGGFIRQET